MYQINKSCQAISKGKVLVTNVNGFIDLQHWVFHDLRKEEHWLKKMKSKLLNG
jgi:hypothetical protein